MKKFINLLLQTLVVSSCNDSHRIIDNPYVESANSNIYDVTRVELSDTATVVHLETHYLPGWWIMPLRLKSIRFSRTLRRFSILIRRQMPIAIWLRPTMLEKC